MSKENKLNFHIDPTPPATIYGVYIPQRPNSPRVDSSDKDVGCYNDYTLARWRQLLGLPERKP
jgi:hypothetical protein